MASPFVDSDEKTEQKEETVNFYQLLGVTCDATKKQIKKGYYSKARELHPDRNETMTQSNAEKAFDDLTFAYKVLIDDNLRELYDRFGKNAIDSKLNIDMTKINIVSLFNQLTNDEDDDNKQKKPPTTIIKVEYDENDLQNGNFIVFRLFLCFFNLLFQ